ncbi:MAG: sugar ABC transporter ATP-binding protein [Anaerolineae bacterium]|nr:sugar ABC transporter ATP-binding protein [Anaerolineae bacterium]MDW8172686.1 sugar ABC transporter ATP-binding protein [Anaerolineae bacterium]
MSQALISFEHISKQFPGVRALDDVSFEVQAGQVHVLMGENGAGKSTLMKILAGVYQPDSGIIRLAGQPISLHDPLSAAAQDIAMIYQELTVLDNLDVGRNIMLGQEPSRGGLVNWKALYMQAQAIVDELELGLDVRTPLSRLSLAERQMVEIARAVRRQPRIIVMDEPTSSLGKHEEEVLFALIGRLKARGAAILYISHRMDEVFRLADTITVLRDGAHITTEPAAHFTRERLIELMVGRKVEAVERQARPRGAVVLEARELVSGRLLRGVTLQLAAGEVLGVAGLAGSGQTELARVLFGVRQPQSGSLWLDGRQVRFRSPQEAIAHGVAYVPEDRKSLGLVLMMGVQANMSLAALTRYQRHGLIDFARLRQLVADWTQRLNIKASVQQESVELLSGGNQQKVVLAKWLALQPRVLILNEPTRGIDVGAKAEVHQLIREIAAGGMAVLMISSELPEVLSVSDRIIVMRQGRISGELLAHEADETRVLALAFADLQEAG